MAKTASSHTANLKSLDGPATEYGATSDDPASITTERLRTCLASASYWVGALPTYANRQQNKADAWAIASGILAAITGLAVFPTAGNDNAFATVLVSVSAFLAAAFALVPRVKNYGEMAGKAREIATSFGPIQGNLMDALAEAEAGKGTDAARRVVVDAFQAAKAKKDELRYLKPRT